jgi:hypothetical protein
MELCASQFQWRGVWLLCACAHRKLHTRLRGTVSTVAAAVNILAWWWKVVFFFTPRVLCLKPCTIFLNVIKCRIKLLSCFLRSTVNSERLNALTVLSIEKNFLSCHPEIKEKIIDLFAQIRTWRIDFIFKWNVWFCSFRTLSSFWINVCFLLHNFKTKAKNFLEQHPH